jgi:glycosyltransferase involved in cell wall biosynthesis
MKISVIIPTYNRSKFLQKAINSVLLQTVKIDEVIVIDDGSSDNTKTVIQDFNNPRIKYIYQTNKGVSSARNIGMDIARNNWITFLDSDDIWDIKKIEYQINFHQNNPNILFSHTDELWLRNNQIIKQKKHQKKPFGKDCFKANLSFCKIGTSTVMLNKEIINNIGYFDNKLKICEDYDYYLRISQRYEIGYINHKLTTKIAGHQGQLSQSDFIDKYKLLTLSKYSNHKYQKYIEIEKVRSYNILLNGAKKYNNTKILDFLQKFK